MRLNNVYEVKIIIYCYSLINCVLFLFFHIPPFSQGEESLGRNDYTCRLKEDKPVYKPAIVQLST
jgi:hypothetical protein